jgi:hypothetical protein
MREDGRSGVVSIDACDPSLKFAPGVEMRLVVSLLAVVVQSLNPLMGFGEQRKR